MSSTASQCTLHQILFQDISSHHHHQQDFLCVSSSSSTINITASPPATITTLPFESPKTLIPPPSLAPLPSGLVAHQSSSQNNYSNIHHHPRDNNNLSSLFSLHKSIPNMWGCEEVNNERRKGRSREDSSKMMMGVKKTRRKVREPRFSFKTMSDVDVLDDGYKWRKYGQKVVKNTHHPRSYYRCTQDNCRVKKRVERLVEDPRMVITTYEGRHVHSPSRDEDDDLQPSSQCINVLLW